ncbi:hypothetical protein Tco_0955374 [Tanacetum coccineum]|uniref:Uncharacterized protein n=1 Tax=Tanacetum coccineum TaxID=301880 RepID=A0ABQ5E747_9ASTR
MVSAAEFCDVVRPTPNKVPHSETYLNNMENQSVHAMQDFEQPPAVDFTDNEIHSDSNIIQYSQYLQETQQENVQDTHLQAQQDSMILSMIEQMKAQRINPTLYDGIIISDKHVAMPVIDDEETLILEEKSRSKMSEKAKDPEVINKNISHKPIDYEKLNRISEDFRKRFTPQQEMDAEQAFWFCISNPTSKPSDAYPVKIEAPKEPPKVSLVNESLQKFKFHLARFDNVVKIRTTPDARTKETKTSLPALPDFISVFKFKERVFNLEKDLSEIKQVDQYAKSLSFILVIVDRYIDNKLGDTINKAIQAHNFDCREEAQAEKREYIVLDDSTKNVSKSLEVVVLTKSSSQPQSSYEAAATLSEFELTKILIDKMENNKSFDVADYKKELYDALVKSYNTDKDIFKSYGEVFSLKRSRDERDKDRDPSAGSDRGTKRRKSSKDVESSRDSRSKEKKSSSTCKSITELEYHFEEFSKATTKRLDWHNPENKPYPFDLRKPLLLIQDHRGRQSIPQDYFINNDLEYLKGGDLSRRYSTSMTKTKAATYC